MLGVLFQTSLAEGQGNEATAAAESPALQSCSTQGPNSPSNGRKKPSHSFARRPPTRAALQAPGRTTTAHSPFVHASSSWQFSSSDIIQDKQLEEIHKITKQSRVRGIPTLETFWRKYSFLMVPVS